MVHIYVSDVIDAPIAKVWAILRDFNGLPHYHPSLFDRSEIEHGRPADAVGCVRSFHTVDGGHLREELLALSTAIIAASTASSNPRCRSPATSPAAICARSPKATAPSSSGGRSGRPTPVRTRPKPSSSSGTTRS